METHVFVSLSNIKAAWRSDFSQMEKQNFLSLYRCLGFSLFNDAWHLLTFSWFIVFLLDTVRHYEVVYLVHEKHAEEVESVNEKVQGHLSRSCISVLSFLYFQVNCMLIVFFFLGYYHPFIEFPTYSFGQGIDIFLCRFRRKADGFISMGLLGIISNQL